MSLKLVTVVGARPQFIKASVVSRVVRTQYAGVIDERLLHTGQHHDDNMAGAFFDELDIPTPSFNLGIAGGSHGEMTGRMLEGIERVLVGERPDWVLVYGDTNSTLAGAVAAAKLGIPVGHVEAGLRSFNRAMPEEINRVVTDRLASLLFCPTAAAVQNLQREGITAGVHLTGDVMLDVALHYREQAKATSQVHASLGLRAGGYALATCHRAENTDDVARLGEIVGALGALSKELPVVFPMHPRTRARIESGGLAGQLAQVKVIQPLPFLDMMALVQGARVIVTDSGGLQKEAFFHRVPCVTVRDETEWVETVTGGWNRLTAATRSEIVSAVAATTQGDAVAMATAPYGDGQAAGRIVAQLVHG